MRPPRIVLVVLVGPAQLLDDILAWFQMVMQQEEDLTGKRIMITGGTGSFGHHFVDYVLRNYRPARLVIFSRDEAKQHEMAQRFRVDEHPSLRYFIGDVRDLHRLEMAMQTTEIVVHAAALKHVPIAEYNPFECLHTNVTGAENVIRAAMRTGVRKVMALSTDKAVSPINLYGASKLAAEKLFVAGNNLAGEAGPRFAIARYGNVVGSRGSVIPFFRALIEKGTDHLPITDPRMTRFWITLRQGVQFVLSSLSMMQGGEIFVPKVKTMRVTDLAKLMAPDLPQKVVGIRPGEKLHETLVSVDESREARELGDRYVIPPALSFWTEDNVSRLGGRPVPSDFHFVSSDPAYLMAPDQLRSMLAA
jgi:UDP-N-acetylglucosamine 4,6-dehydratase/5-epimerase